MTEGLAANRTQTSAETPFKHIVITRFSAVFVHDQEPATEDWLFYRLGFFFDALHPSLTRQEGNPDFTWLVYFDDRCSDDFRVAVEEMADGAFVPVWTHERFYDDFRTRVAQYASDAPYLMTTRVDSDDAVAKDYIRTVQSEFVESDKLSLNFPRGVQVDRQGRVFQYDEPSGPFQTLIERRVPGELPQTVFGQPRHGMARSHSPLREVIAEPMWLQILHGSNIANEIRGVRVSPEVIARRFNIELAYDAETSRNTVWRERAMTYGIRVRLWVRRPHFALERVDALYDRARGTRTRPMDPNSEGPPLVSAYFTRVLPRLRRVLPVRPMSLNQVPSPSETRPSA